VPVTRTLEELDPAWLLIDVNVRTHADLTPQFKASVKDLGVLEAVTGVRLDDGRVKVRLGQRRTLAAVEAGLTTIPVIVLEGGDTSEVERIIDQISENHHRAPLSSLEMAAGINALFNADVPAGKIARRLHIDKPDIEAARVITATPQTVEVVAASPGLTLEQSAQLAGFADDPQTVTALTEAAKKGPGTFAHVWQEAVDDRATAEAITARRAELTAAGTAVLDASLGYEYQLYEWDDADGQRLTEDTHKDCPGHAMWIRAAYSGRAGEISETAFCTDPKANGHKRHRITGSTDKPEAGTPEAAAAYREVREGNKAWRSARKVRTAWLTQFCARKTLPAPALSFLLGEVIAGNGSIRRAMESRNRKTARALLGLGEDTSGGDQTWMHADELSAAFATASPGRQQVIAWAFVCAAIEDRLTDQDWRGSGASTSDRTYLTTLSALGYQLAPIEHRAAGQPIPDPPAQEEAPGA
jgi:ParB family transcriptional regulator, chromosome partitioning protein